MAFAAAALLAPLSAVPGGRLGVLPLGYWQCGTPGDAMGAAFVVDEERSFVTRRNSSYTTEDGRGTYLLTGTTVTFTRGPLRGLTFEREDRNRLRLTTGFGVEGASFICNRRSYRPNPVLSGR